jgi:transcriptional regulator EpsA
VNSQDVSGTALLPTAPSLQLTAAERASLLGIMLDSLSIKCHHHIYVWLRGEIQQFIPHQILISAWGNFSQPSKLKLDVTSSLPGVRTEQIAHCRIDDLVRDSYGQWLHAHRRPLLLKGCETVIAKAACTCLVHKALLDMHSLLVHGICDRRGGHESLYIAVNLEPISTARTGDQFGLFVDSLVAQIDVAFRKVAAFPLDDANATSSLELSSREEQILDLLSRGKTNMDIATVLDISPFTVKNHMQRIFRKLGVTNRTQAVFKYNERVQQTPANIA